MTDETQKTITTQVISWAAGQPFNNVLLLAILGCIIWSTYFAMTTAIPAHLKQIQDGYQSLTESHREERKELRETYSQWMQRAESKPTSGTAVAGRHE